MNAQDPGEKLRFASPRSAHRPICRGAHPAALPGNDAAHRTYDRSAHTYAFVARLQIAPFPVTASRLPLSLLGAVFLAGGLFLSGCGTTEKTTAPGLPDEFPDHSASQIGALITQSGDSLQSYSAEARVTVRTPERNRSFNAEMRQRRADSLFMRFSLFGVEGGRLLLTRDSVLFYDSRNRVLRTGPLTDAQELFPVPLTSGEIFNNMLGLLAPASSRDWSLEADSNQYFLSASSNSTTRLTVDPTRWRTVRYTRENDRGTVVDERLFTDFRRVDGVLIPHRVIFRRPADDLMAMIRYRDVNLNPAELSFELGVPSAIPRKPFR